ncbi:hypothetical protein [Deinococcus sp.]|uniref:hypothetical protein n=1 Tax=Deinococcus sp. TaxID=47478 RepID=UPI0025C3B2EA|nr:hypothetical protein [Deinococcus sp.]
MPERATGPIHALRGFVGSGKTTLARTMETQLGAPLTLHALAVPDAQARRRVQARNARPGALFIANDTFELLRPRCELLTPDEEALQDVTRWP